MSDRLAYLWPEIVLFATSCVVLVVGLSGRAGWRRLCAPVSVAGLVVAGWVAYATTPTAGDPRADTLLLPAMVPYAKVLVAAVGVLLLLVVPGTADGGERAGPFDPLRATHAEFYALVLYSLTGVMLCAAAHDLIWLFLALELTSLPTYVLVTISSRSARAQEAGVKYFFLGALGAAMFLYGFALMYGGTGSLRLAELAEVVAADGINGVMLAGLLLSLVGVAFKIAAVPMHFYTPDVYQGASSSVAALLAFVPKTAGFLAIMQLCAVVGWTYGAGASSLPDPVRLLLWVMAALSMTVGNVLAILQSSAKRLLAYSSIAHSGYMLVGVIAGPGGAGRNESLAGNGLAVVLFYLLAYGVMNTGAFAVLASLRRAGRPGDEVDAVADLRGLWRSRPMLAAAMGLCALSLLGMPPMLGFWGKLPLFTAAISAGEIPLVVVLGINSAIAAFYYLRLVMVPWLEDRDVGTEPLAPVGVRSRVVAAVGAGAAVVVLAASAAPFMRAAERAAVVEIGGGAPSAEAMPGGVVR